MLKICQLSKKIDKKYITLLFISILSLFTVLLSSIIIKALPHKILSTKVFLILHFFSELLSILVSFSVFAVLYYTFDVFKTLRNIIISQTFFLVGAIDTFHLISYKGMIPFFAENSPQNATAFWILARLTMAMGLLISSLIPRSKKTIIKKELFIILSLLFISGIHYLVIFNGEFFPNLYIDGYGITSFKIYLEYIVIFFLLVTGIILLDEYNKLNDVQVLYFIIAVAISIFSEFTFTIYGNVYDIYNLFGHMLKAISYYIMFRIFFLSNIRIPYERLAEVKSELKEQANNLQNLVEEKTRELTETNKKLLYMNNKMIEDLEAAKGIQQALLPNKFVDFNDVKFYSEYIPCQRLSGDFYNYFRIDDENIGMYIIDVSGHGLSAGMVTVFAAKSIDKVKEIDERDNRKKLIQSPKDVLTNFYHIFNDSNFPDEIHLVMFYGVYNTKTRIFKYSSAGLNCYPIHISHDGNVKFLNDTRGFPICKLRDFYIPEYKNFQIELSKEDKLLFYTDGVTELKNKNHEIYSPARLISLTKNAHLMESEELINLIKGQLLAYKGIGDLEDDITLFVMEVKK